MTEELELSKGSQIRAAITSGHRGVELRSLDDFYRFAQYVIAARMAPKGIENEAGVLIALQRGAEVGLLPMQSLQSIYMVANQPHLYGDAPKAIVEASGLMEDCKEFEEGKYPEPTYKWVCKVKRRGRDWRVSEFSIADAKTAQLWEKKSTSGAPSPWVLYPKRMLMWRARGYALRDEFSDVLKGFPIRELANDEDAAFAGAKPLREVSSAFETATVLPAAARRPRGRPPKAQEPVQLAGEQLAATLAQAEAGSAAPPKEKSESPLENSSPLSLHETLLEKLAAEGFSEAELLAIMIPRNMAPRDAKSLSVASAHHLSMCLEDWEAATDLMLKARELL